jgi:hypothetical protein
MEFIRNHNDDESPVRVSLQAAAPAGTPELFLYHLVFQMYKSFLLNVLCFLQDFLIFLFPVPDVFICPTRVGQMKALEAGFLYIPLRELLPLIISCLCTPGEDSPDAVPDISLLFIPQS